MIIFLKHNQPFVSCVVVLLSSFYSGGVVHQEIFTFERPPGAPFAGTEWENITRPIIEKWCQFVEEFYD